MSCLNQNLPSHFTCLPVASEHLANGLRMTLGGSLQYCFYCTRYPRKRNASFKKGFHGDFIRRIKCNAMSAALFGGLIGQAKTRETGEVRWFEMELAERRHVESQVRLNSLGITHSVENRQPHVGHGNLSQEAAVDVFHQRVHRRLRMDGYFN